MGEYLDRWWQTSLSNPKAMVEWLRGINIESINVTSTSTSSSTPPLSTGGGNVELGGCARRKGGASVEHELRAP